MWKLKTTTVSMMTGILKRIRKGTDKHIGKIPSEVSLKENQKIVKRHCRCTKSKTKK